MLPTTVSPVLRHLRKLVAVSTTQRTADVDLLRRFSVNQDETAFAELMRRHGPLVLSVCRRVLGHEQDGEDVFQAAFLVLARKAGSIRQGESVGSFLYSIAYRIARRERGKRLQRLKREQRQQQMIPSGPVSEAAFRELQRLLDEGLNRLPEKYRTPFVLCCLEGRSKSEAAHELGWKEGTVSSRLAQARQKMQQFLSRKGISLAAVLTAVGIVDNTATACVSPLLAASALRTAMRFAAGSSALFETAKAVQLAETVLRNMAVFPWKTATALLFTVCLVAGGVGLARQSEKTPQDSASAEQRAAVNDSDQSERQEKKIRTDRYGDSLPEGAIARLGTVRFRQGFFTRQVAFSPNGKIIACVGAGRAICLWDAATGKVLRQIGEASHGTSIAFSPDGRVLACSFDFGGEPGLYETNTGRKQIEFPKGFGGYPIGLAYSPDGKTIAGSEVGTNKVLFVDAATGEKRKVDIPAKHPEDISRITWSPDSKTLAWIGKDGIVHLWDALKGEEASQWKAHEKDVFSLAFSPDGKTLATGGAEETICLWDIATQKKRHTLDGKRPSFPSNKHVNVRLMFSRDGKLLASGRTDGTIALWDAREGKEVRSWQAHAFSVASVDFSPDSKTLVSGAFWECGPRLWDVATGTEVQLFAGQTSAVERVMFSPDGKHLRSTGREKKVFDWDLATGRETLLFHYPLHDSQRMYDAYTLSARGDKAATWGNKDNTIRLWDVVSGKEDRTLGQFERAEKNSAFYAPLEFSPDGRLLAFGTKDRVVAVWDAIAGAEKHKLKGLAGQVHCVAFSHDGKKIAAGSTRGIVTLGIWDVATGQSLASSSNQEIVDRMVFSPDGKLLATASWRSQEPPQLWDAATGRLLRTLTSGPRLDGFYDLAFSPDGKWLAGAGADKDQKIHVWEVTTGLEVRTFHGHIATALSVAFSPDGRAIASGGGDSSILLWDFTGRGKDGRLQAAKWTPRELEKRWIDLASSGRGPQAVQAIWDFVAAPEQAMPLLRQRIKPVQPPEPADAKLVERLIGDLDNEDFEVRSKATERLMSIEAAAPALRKRLTERPTLEVRQRIKQILDEQNRSAESKELLGLRAIQVLEHVGTAEARNHLRTLAKGIPEAQVTREAQAALKRLSK